MSEIINYNFEKSYFNELNFEIENNKYKKKRSKLLSNSKNYKC